MPDERLLITPEPKTIKFSGSWAEFDGFANFPRRIAKDFDIPSGKWRIVQRARGRKDGYTKVLVDGSKVTVEILGDRFTGLATIIQLQRQRTGYLPLVELSERFDFKFRWFHLDIARGGVPTLQTFRKIIRWLFLLKYNGFAIYFEDLFPWRTYRGIGKARGGITKQELEAIIRYASSYGITVIPSLQFLGHMEHFFELERYAKHREMTWPEDDWTLDAGGPEARKFALNLLGDALAISESPYVHVGGDESWTLGRGKSLDRSGVYKGPELYLRHFGAILRMVKRSGKTPMMWGDMLTGMYLSREERKRWSKVIRSKLWKDTIIANWDYDPETPEHFRKKIRSIGHEDRQLACPTLWSSRKFYPNFEFALTNLKNFLTAARDLRLLGFMVTAWADNGAESFFSFLDPLILASMEIAEGSGSWEKKWGKLSGEGENVVRTRRAFGAAAVAENTEEFLYSPLSKADNMLTATTRKAWKNAVARAKGLKLSPDLEFMRSCLEVGLKAIEGRAKSKDYVELSDEFSRLWLSERKKEGLETILTRLAGCAAVLDRGL